MFTLWLPEGNLEATGRGYVGGVSSSKSISAQRALARTAAGVTAQARHVGYFLASLPAPTFTRATRVPGWDLRLLTAHLVARQQQLIEDLPQGTSARPVTAADFLRSAQNRGRQITEHAEAIGADDDGPTLARRLRCNVGEMAALVDQDLPDVIDSQPPLRLRDALRLEAVEWLVHADDVNQVFGAEPVTLEAQAVADAIRCLAEALAHDHPGHSIEVRVPPYIAVQCGADGDPAHTRGTPPNVVEFDAMVFARVATGRLAFADAVGRGVTASGTRANIADMFPLL